MLLVNACTRLGLTISTRARAPAECLAKRARVCVYIIKRRKGAMFVRTQARTHAAQCRSRAPSARHGGYRAQIIIIMCARTACGVVCACVCGCVMRVLMRTHDGYDNVCIHYIAIP